MKKPDREEFWMDEEITIGNGSKSIPFNHVQYEWELENYCKYLEEENKKLKRSDRKNHAAWVMSKMKVAELEDKIKKDIVNNLCNCEDENGTYMEQHCRNCGGII